jgi:translation initiation factor IF-1
MASDDLIELEGVVTHVWPGSVFEVSLDNGSKVSAHISGKIRQHKIKIVLQDRVTVAVTPYDLKKGRIVYRHK